MKSIRVIVVEDHHLFRRAIVQAFETSPDFEVVTELEHGGSLLEAARGLEFDLVVLDLGMRSGAFDPVSTVVNFKSAFPKKKVLVVSAFTDGAYARGVVEAGIDGYIVKDDRLSLKLVQSARRVIKGEKVFSEAISDYIHSASFDQNQLSRQEASILGLAASGRTNREIAASLSLSEKTVRNHFTSILRKLGARNRVEAINKGRDLDLI